MNTRDQMIADCEQKHGFKPTPWRCARPEGHRGNCKMVPALSFTGTATPTCRVDEYVDYAEVAGNMQPHFPMAAARMATQILGETEGQDMGEFRNWLVTFRDAMDQRHTANRDAYYGSKSLEGPDSVPADSLPM